MNVEYAQIEYNRLRVSRYVWKRASSSQIYLIFMSIVYYYEQFFILNKSNSSELSLGIGYRRYAGCTNTYNKHISTLFALARYIFWAYTSLHMHAHACAHTLAHQRAHACTRLRAYACAHARTRRRTTAHALRRSR